MNRHFSKRFKISYSATVLIGLAAHLFALTNVLKNHDNILMIGYGAGTTSGRWFMGWIGDIIHDIWGNYNIPFFNGLLGIFLLSFAAYLGIMLFNIQDITLCILWGGLFVSFPAITSMMFYIYAVPYYSVAILMNMGAVYLAKRYRYGWCLSIPLLTCSLGIYQAYYPLAAGLFVLVLICSSITGKWSVKKSFQKAFYYLGVLAAGMIGYFIILRLRLHVLNLELNTYKGINDMGKIQIKELPAMLKRTYLEVFRIPFDGYYQMANTKIISWMLIFLALLSILMIGLLLKSKKTAIRQKWPAIIFLALYPAAINSITLMCYHSTIYTLMIFAGVLIYLLPICLLSITEKTAIAQMKPKSFSLLRTCTCCALCLVLTNYIWQSNGNYTSMYYTDQQMYYYLNSMVTQVKEVDGFHTDLKWAFVGKKVNDPLMANPWIDTPFWYGGNKKHLINEYSRDRFFNQILGYNIPWASDEEIKALRKNPTVKSMAAYPNDGSIAIVNDIIVIKLK